VPSQASRVFLTAWSRCAREPFEVLGPFVEHFDAGQDAGQLALASKPSVVISTTVT
jgi:hypothetical protein